MEQIKKWNTREFFFLRFLITLFWQASLLICLEVDRTQQTTLGQMPTLFQPVIGLPLLFLRSLLITTQIVSPNVSHAILPLPSSETHSAMKGLPFPVMQPAVGGAGPELDAHGQVLTVPTKMNYVTPDVTEIHVRRDVTGCDSVYEGAQWDPVELRIHNARGKSLTLDENGFELRPDEIREIDFLNTQSVIDDYYPACEALLKRVLGPNVAVVKAFDHNVRISSSSWGDELKGGGGSKAQVPLGMVHGDYTKVSGPRRLEDLSKPPKANDVLKQRLGETPLLDKTMVEEANSGKRRFALINVWRNIDSDNPVQEFPLGCVDAKTVPYEGLKTLFIHYEDRVGENYFCSYNPSHGWFYFPEMTYKEALLIKQWDSHGSFAQSKPDVERSTFAIHSAFVDPTSPERPAPRKSIEVRCAAIWDKESDLQ